MKIGVTGATGLLGQIVIELLKNKVPASQIVALVRSPKKAEGLGVEVRESDYSKPESLDEALKGIDKLLLISGNEIGKRFEQHNNVIEAARRAGVKHLVYTSLLKADTSTLVLAGEHLATENALKNSGITYTILRNGWYTENYFSSISGALAAGALTGSSGEGKTSPAARTDFAKAAVAVLTGSGFEGETFELAGDEAFTMSDLAAEISKQTGRNIPYVNFPEAEYAKALTQTGLPEGVAGFFAGTHTATEKGDLFDDGHQLSQITGEPTTPLVLSVAEALKSIQ